MSLKDSYRVYGASPVRIDMNVLADIGRMITKRLAEHNQRPVVTLAVAAMLIQMHSDIAGVDVDETIELVHNFIKTLDMSQKPKA